MITGSRLINRFSLVAILVVFVMGFNIFFKIEPAVIRPTKGLEPICVMIDKSKSAEVSSDDSINFEVLGGIIRIEDFYIKLCNGSNYEKYNEYHNETPFGTTNIGIEK